MKLTHFALGAIMLLLMAACYLLMQTENDKREIRTKERFDELAAQLKKLEQGRPSPPAASESTPAVAGAPQGSAASDTPAVPTPAPKSPASPLPAPVSNNPSVAAAPQPGANPTADPKAAPGSPVPNLAPMDLNDKEARVVAELQRKMGPAPANQLNELQKRIAALPAIAKVKSFNPEHSFVVIDAGKLLNLTPGMKFQIRRDAMLIGKAQIGDTVDDAESVANIDPATVPVGVEIKPGDQLVQFDGR